MTTAPLPMADARTLPLLGRAKLRAETRLRDGTSLPDGSIGTIVEVLGGGAAYIVEFVQPKPAVATLRAEELLAVR